MTVFYFYFHGLVGKWGKKKECNFFLNDERLLFTFAWRKFLKYLKLIIRFTFIFNLIWSGLYGRIKQCVR